MKLKNIYTYGGKPEQRALTVADLINSKGKQKYSQTCPNDKEESAACVEAGIDVINCSDQNLKEVRKCAPETICIADLPMTSYRTKDEILAAAIKAAEIGADIIYTPRSFDIVEMLAKEGLSVQGHAGLIPRRSTQFGGLRIIGKTSDEAMQVVENLKRLEDAGAQCVEVECIPADILNIINSQTKLVTHSIGAGSGGDVIFMFLEDICGDAIRSPAHAQAFGDIATIRVQLKQERVRSLNAFHDAVHAGNYPNDTNIVSMAKSEVGKFLKALENRNPFHQ